MALFFRVAGSVAEDYAGWCGIRQAHGGGAGRIVRDIDSRMRGNSDGLHNDDATLSLEQQRDHDG
jgi:hypothetical protein